MSFLSNIFGSKEITDFKELVNKGAVIIDVRSQAEYNSGHIPGSVNIPLEQTASSVGLLKKKNIAFITVCRSGMRSNMAAGVLKNAGLEVYNGGAWDYLKKKIS